MTGFSPLSPDDPRDVAGYVLHARIGAGGMGAVYLSFTPGGRPIAIKVIRPVLADDEEFRRRFRQEIAAAQQVQGLYTAPVIDADPDGPMPWMATAYVPGPSLDQVVREHGPLPVPTVFRLMAGVAEALGTIHAAGVIHRDLKPSNVLLSEDGPRVIDFGIARAADATSLTRTGVRIGTPGYMTPEQVQGTPVQPATDVFALGQLCVFAATGLPAFGEGSTEVILYRIAYEQPSLDDCPAALRDIVSRCLAKQPGERPSVQEVIRLAREETAGETMRMAGPWLPPAVAATLVAYDAGAARRVVPEQTRQDRVVREPTTEGPVVREPTTEVGPVWLGPPVPPPQLSTPVRHSGGISMTAAVALTAVVAAAVLLAAIVGARLLSPSAPSTSAANAGGHSPIPADVTSGQTAPTAPTTVTATQRRSTDQGQPTTSAQSGFRTYTEQGFTIDVPSDWRRRVKPGDSSGSVYWDAPDGVSYLHVDPEPWSPGSAHTQAQMADTSAAKNGSRFPGYHLIGINDVVFQQDAADWDFGFNDAAGAGPIHGRDRFFQAGGRQFAIYLRAAETSWPGMQDKLGRFYSSFRP